MQAAAPAVVRVGLAALTPWYVLLLLSPTSYSKGSVHILILETQTGLLGGATGTGGAAGATPSGAAGGGGGLDALVSNSFLQP